MSSGSGWFRYIREVQALDKKAMQCWREVLTQVSSTASEVDADFFIP